MMDEQNGKGEGPNCFAFEENMVDETDADHDRNNFSTENALFDHDGTVGSLQADDADEIAV